MTLEGELVRDRGIAGELMLRRGARMRGSQSERLVGTFAGFQVFVADTALGTTRSVEHAIQNLEDLADSLARAITDTRKRLADTQAQIGAPFEYAGQLVEPLRRQEEIDNALDLTQHQVPGQVEAGQPDAAEAIEDA